MHVATRNKKFWFQNLTITYSADRFSLSSSLSTKGKQTLKMKLYQRSVSKKNISAAGKRHSTKA